MGSGGKKNQDVINLVQVVLSVWLFTFGIISVIIGTYGHITTLHYSSLNHSYSETSLRLIDNSSGPDLLITAGVIQVFVSVLGVFGSFVGLMDGFQRIGTGFMIAYAVLLLVTAGVNLSSAITAYGGYDDFESGAIELLRRLYLNNIGDAINRETPLNALGGVQRTLGCCGVWSYTDYDENGSLGGSSSSPSDTSSETILPDHCCPPSTQQCKPANAYTTGCMPKLQEFIYHTCIPGASSLNCVFSSLVEVDANLFAVFIVGLVQALVSILFFVGTILQIIYSVNFFKNIISNNEFPQPGDQYYSGADVRAPSPTPVNTRELI